MGSYDLSVIIPSRNEPFLARTIQEVLTKRRGRTEVIAVLDGAWPVEPIEDWPDVTLIHHAVSIGQRAAINEAARLSKATFIMKLDAHCALSEGFDTVLMRDCQYDWTLVPRMYNLHAFDWQCNHCKNRTYQGPKPQTCQLCGKAKGFEQVIVWQPRWNRKSDHYRFDRDLIFKYWGAYGNRPEVEAQGEVRDTMSLLGACFFMHRERYWDLGGSDEGTGSWGQQGVEIACKTWLSGGRLATHTGCWFSHLFRTQPGFGFPYAMPQSAVDKAREHSRSVWLNDKWPLAKRPLSWLIEKFRPVPDWHDEAPAVHTKQSKGIVYYTENHCPEPVFSAVQEHLRRAAGDMRIVSVSLKPIDFGDNLVLGLERGIKTMFEQILAGLAELDTDVAFLCEHDCLYPKEHFEFTPRAQSRPSRCRPSSPAFGGNDLTTTRGRRTAPTLVS